MGAREPAVTRLIDAPADALRGEFRSLEFAREEFPMLTTWGVDDFSHTIHSLGCNYLSAFGRQCGYWAISDYPIRVDTRANGHSVRPDVAWWDKSTSGAVLLGEFERVDGRGVAKLVDKARNLLEAHHALSERPRILLLVGWTLAGTEVGCLNSVRAVMHDGFRPTGGYAIPGLEHDSRFILGTAVFGDVGGARRLVEVRL